VTSLSYKSSKNVRIALGQATLLCMETEQYTKRLQQAAEQLARVDHVLAPVIAQYGPCTIQPHHNYYEALVGEIIGQQLLIFVVGL
jgi:3-methyladenine DNA glycosylase/8-oxoguanine DNA glycosylase